MVESLLLRGPKGSCVPYVNWLNLKFIITSCSLCVVAGMVVTLAGNCITFRAQYDLSRGSDRGDSFFVVRSRTCQIAKNSRIWTV